MIIYVVISFLGNCSIIVFMDFEYSVGWMFGGLLIALVGGLIVFFYKPIADNMASGVSSYERVKLFGIITIVVGLLITANLHTLILSFFVDIIFNR